MGSGLVGGMKFFNTKMRVTLIGLILILLMGSCAEESKLERTKRLANDGDSMAQNNLGSMYYNGEGVPQDYKEAAKWYRKSAEQGDADAQSNLGYMYYIGTGVIEDYVTAYAWVSVAKANGNAKSVKALDILTKKMTKEQIVQAKSLATEIQKRIEANRKD